MRNDWLIAYPENSLVQKAYRFALKAHEGVFRKSGEPFITHPLSVAETTHLWGLDEASVASAFLHDVCEDTNFNIKEIEKNFGEEIAFLVSGLTKIKKFNYGKDSEVENIRKLIISFSKDLRVILIKLADRLHNMRTLQFFSEEKQKRISLETMDIYAPIAYRLGMQKLSGELEDLAFPFLYPEEYKWMFESMDENHEERERFSKKVCGDLKQMLNESGISFVALHFRAKHYYSLYRKLLRNDMDITKIYDLSAIRVIVKTVEECYAALGIIHKHWLPLQGKIKDYIARPKPNGYRSIHTIVSSSEGKLIEIQIKTDEMHKENEYGIAAHWAYEQSKCSKEKFERDGITNKKELLWVEQLRNWQNKFKNQEEFIKALKIDFFKDRIFVFTPKNDVFDLPSGSTPIDFAYKIHSDVGDECVGAKVNGKIVQLNFELSSGDVVEIITQKKKKPSRDWLNFTKTSLAQKHIRNVLNLKSKSQIPQHFGFPGFEFKIVCDNKPGILNEITKIFSDFKVNINFVYSDVKPNEAFAVLRIRCGKISKERLNKFLVCIKKVDGVREVGSRYLR